MNFVGATIGIGTWTRKNYVPRQEKTGRPSYGMGMANLSTLILWILNSCSWERKGAACIARSSLGRHVANQITEAKTGDETGQRDHRQRGYGSATAPERHSEDPRLLSCRGVGHSVGQKSRKRRTWVGKENTWARDAVTTTVSSKPWTPGAYSTKWVQSRFDVERGIQERSTSTLRHRSGARDEAVATGVDREEEDPERQVMGIVTHWDREERYGQAPSPHVSAGCFVMEDRRGPGAASS